MGQKWTIANFDARESQGHLASLKLALFPTANNDDTTQQRVASVADRLLRTVAGLVVRVDSLSALHPLESALYLVPSENVALCTSPLSNLPVELIDCVFEHLAADGGGLLDTAALALASQRLWEVGRVHVRRRLAAFVPCWAKQRIGIVGEHAALDAFPRALQPLLKPKGKDDEPFKLVGRTFAKKRASPFGAWFGARNLLTSAPCAPGNDDRFAPRERRLLSRLLAAEWRDAARDDAVLLNWTTSELVRRKALRALEGTCARGGWTPAHGLGEALVSRVCLSTERPADFHHAYDDAAAQLHRGAWFGHRFQVATLAELDELNKAAAASKGAAAVEWKDVSDQVVKELSLIWAAEESRT